VDFLHSSSSADLHLHPPSRKYIPKWEERSGGVSTYICTYITNIIPKKVEPNKQARDSREEGGQQETLTSSSSP
jgi:hypothetical protein